MKASDLSRVAELHIRSFDGYFLSRLGPGFVRRLYHEYRSPADVALVAERSGEIVGFVLGSTDLSAVYRRFYRRNLPFIGYRLLERAGRDPETRHQIGQRVGHFRVGLLAIVGRRAEPITPIDEPDGAELVSIGVAPKAQGSPTASMLVAGFLDELRKRSVSVAKLSVRQDNERAIRFYQREGWQRIGVSGDEFRYAITLSTNASLPGSPDHAR